MKILTTIFRFLVGPLFIFSGWIKVNDPLGFSYKLNEYFDVFANTWMKDFSFLVSTLHWMKDVSLYLAIFLSVFEIGLGVVTLIGYRMKFFSWLLFLLIVFFSFLTFYSAWNDVVKDCGCFGDFMHLKPWTSFSKDVALFILTGTILLQRKNITCMFSEKIGLIVTILGFAVSTGYAVHCYRHLPVVDLRPYKIGTNILEAMKMPPNAVTDSFATTLIYTKDGVAKEFNQKNYPWQDSTWKWKETKNKMIREGTHPPIHDFKLTDLLGGDVDDNDTLYTRKFLTDKKFSFFLVSYDLNKSDKDKELMKKINDFYDAARKDSLNMIALTATDAKTIDKFKHENQALYDFYLCDETALKTFIRSNPGLVLLKNGTVLGMWHCNDFPTYGEVKSGYFK